MIASGLSLSTFARRRPDSWMTRPAPPSSAPAAAMNKPEVRARGLREGGQRGVQPQAAIERDGDARGPVVERDQARVGRPVLAADQRRELRLGRVGPRRREQPLAVRQRDGRAGAVRDRLQHRTFERRAHDHDRARRVVLAARHARRREHEGAALDRRDTRRDADLARLRARRTSR